MSGDLLTIRQEIDACLDASGVVDEDDKIRYARDWRGLVVGDPAWVLRPASVDQVAKIVRICTKYGLSIVPQGGNTGLVRGATPDRSGKQVVMSLERLRKVRSIDTTDMTIVVEAGVTLQDARAAAEAKGAQLPLSIASQGTAQIGGALATNAGGISTVRYGNARDLVLGLEVVLADGRTWNGLRRLRKDNTGYCLRHLFIGSEGTLGIITAAVIKLVRPYSHRDVALVALSSAAAVLELLKAVQERPDVSLLAFEYMCDAGVEFVLSTIPGVTRPFTSRSPHYALIEIGTDGSPSGSGRQALEQLLGHALDNGIARDAVLPDSEAQKLSLWRLREEHTEAQSRARSSIKNDISVPVSMTVEFIDAATETCRKITPFAHAMAFGHLGDGNIHFNLVAVDDAGVAALVEHRHRLIAAVNDIVRGMGGSFSAEHGIGQMKLDMLEDWRGGVELDLMRSIKQAIDPQWLFNPGTMLRPRTSDGGQK